jgi:GNAT superfamily N-acetyltransferase
VSEQTGAPPPALRTSRPLIRPATLADQEPVLAMARRLADFELPPWRTEAEVVAAETRALAAAFEQGRNADDLFVAVDPDGGVLGFVFLERPVDYFTREPHGHVSMLAVARAAEGKGVAAALMRRAEEWARANGFARLTLNVFDGNARARALYERLGYRPDTVRYLKPL